MITMPSHDISKTSSWSSVFDQFELVCFDHVDKLCMKTSSCPNDIFSSTFPQKLPSLPACSKHTVVQHKT